MKVARDFIFDPSLVLYLPLYKLDGASFMSQDAYGHLCTVTGALWRPNGRAFDGDDYIIIDAVSTLQSLTVGSIEVWAKFSELTRNHCLFSASDSGDATSLIALYWELNAQDMYAICYENGSELYNGRYSVSISTDTWYHMVLTQDGITPVLYLDTTKYDIETGEPDTTGWFADVLNIDDVSIGVTHRSAGRMWGHEGNIGEVRVYSRALTPLEIQHNYLATKWRYQ